MVAKHDLSLTPRRENLRDPQLIPPPVQFTLPEILRHFNESLSSLKAQYTVADALAATGNEEGCQTIWRSQVVLAEGLLDFYLHEISKYCLFRMFTGQWAKTEKYGSFLIPLEKLEEALAAPYSQDWFFAYLNERFSREVFLSQDSLREQLNLIGIGFVPVMVRIFPGIN